MKKRWLEWTLVDPRSIVGGVETHLLSMAACLQKRGYEVCFSSDPDVLFRGADDLGHFDVVRTHGAALPKNYLLRVQRSRRTFRIHTLHGTALGMMWGLREWYRVTHYKAFLRELSGCIAAHLVASIHPRLFLHRCFGSWGKAVVIWNGWDSASHDPTARSEVTPPAIAESWLVIGRLYDRVKGLDRALRLLQVDPDIRLAILPGDSTVHHERVAVLNRRGPSEVLKVLRSARGILIPSRYEGMGLVALEALSAGVPVVAASVGGLSHIPNWFQPLEGFSLVEEADDPHQWIRVMNRLVPETQEDRQARAIRNQKSIPTWDQCTERLVNAVKDLT